jgi:hypothetical protein
MKKGELVSGTESISGSVHTDWDKEWGHFTSTRARESIMARRVHQKKKIPRVSPCFYNWNFFETA